MAMRSDRRGQPLHVIWAEIDREARKEKTHALGSRTAGHRHRQPRLSVQCRLGLGGITNCSPPILGLRHLSDELSPGHIDGPINRAGLRSRIVFEDFNHQGRVVRYDDARL